MIDVGVVGRLMGREGIIFQPEALVFNQATVV